MDGKIENVKISGVDFPKMNRQQALSYISEALNGRKAIKIFTPNSEILYKASQEPNLISLLSEADLLLPDGIGVIFASHILQDPLPCRITGIDTAEYILSEAERMALSVYLLGGMSGVAEKAAHELTKKHPRLRIVGAHHGYFRSQEEKRQVVGKIQAASPQILFVCLGFPTQERFISDTLSKLPSVRLAMGLGGCLDVWSGSIRRAPKIIQRVGLEWLYRILSAPKRIKRLPYLLLFGLITLRAAAKSSSAVHTNKKREEL